MMTATIARASTRLTELADPFLLERGGELRDARLAYEAYGDPANPTVIVLGGISAGRHIAAGGPGGPDGWWSSAVGSGLAIDTDRFHVIGIDFLGGAGESTSPSNPNDGQAPASSRASAGPTRDRAPAFPSIDTVDQARALIALLDDLEIARAHAVVGSSYGGMVALAFGARFPDRADRLVVICAAHAAHPMATALRSLQRDIVRLGLRTGTATAALKLARGIAMTTYRTAHEFAERFDNRPARTAAHSPVRYRFPVEDYLAVHGDRFSRTWSPESFLVLSESLDLHGVDPADVRVPTTVVGFDSDALVPDWQIDELVDRLGAPCLRVDIATRYGHDAFLKEFDALEPVLRGVLEQPAEVLQ